MKKARIHENPNNTAPLSALNTPTERIESPKKKQKTQSHTPPKFPQLKTPHLFLSLSRNP